MNWEIGTDMCTVPCARQIANGKLLYSAGAQLVLPVGLDEWNRMGWGEARREVQEEEDMVYVCMYKLVHFTV